MEILFEFIMEIFVELFIAGSKNPKLPIGVRILLFSIIMLIPLGILCLVAVLVYKSSLVMSIIFAVLALMGTVFYLFRVVKMIKLHKRNRLNLDTSTANE